MRLDPHAFLSRQTLSEASVWVIVDPSGQTCAPNKGHQHGRPRLGGETSGRCVSVQRLLVRTPCGSRGYAIVATEHCCQRAGPERKGRQHAARRPTPLNPTIRRRGPYEPDPSEGVVAHFLPIDCGSSAQSWPFRRRPEKKHANPSAPSATGIVPLPRSHGGGGTSGRSRPWEDLRKLDHEVK